MMVSSAAQARTRPITNNRSSPAVLVPRVPGVVRRNAPSRQSLSVTAALKIKEEQTGVEFMVAQKFWKGEDFHCLGAGPRFKKILMLNVKVYAAALFVEGKRAAKEFGVRYRGGFFSNDSDYCDAVLEGAFNKAIIIHLVRDVDGPTFSEAIQKALVPRMQLTGEMDKLAEFTAVFNGKQLSNNTEVVLFWDTTGDLEVVISPPVIEPADYSQVKPDAVIRSAGLTRGLFEVFLGQNSSAPEARAAWIKGAKLLLESENVKRETSKPQ